MTTIQRRYGSLVRVQGFRCLHRSLSRYPLLPRAQVPWTLRGNQGGGKCKLSFKQLFAFSAGVSRPDTRSSYDNLSAHTLLLVDVCRRVSSGNKSLEERDYTYRE